MTAFLALLSAVFIGSADFVGGLASRTASGVRVATFVAIMGLPLAFVVSLAYGAEHVSRNDAIWSALSGIVVAVGIGCFYVGMGRGLITVVAPVAAVTGAVIPVIYGLVRGERPGMLALVGLVVAFVAVAVVSLAQSEQHPETTVSVDRHVIALALASGLFFGLFYITLSRVSDDAGLWPVTISRTGASIVLVMLSLILTRGILGGVVRLWRAVLLIAILEVSAMVPLLLALQRGPVAIASVLASLYPVTTVLLAAFVLRERLSRLQYVGVACALVSVALVSSG